MCHFTFHANLGCLVWPLRNRRPYFFSWELCLVFVKLKLWVRFWLDNKRKHKDKYSKFLRRNIGTRWGNSGPLNHPCRWDWWCVPHGGVHKVEHTLPRWLVNRGEMHAFVCLFLNFAQHCGMCVIVALHLEFGISGKVEKHKHNHRGWETQTLIRNSANSTFGVHLFMFFLGSKGSQANCGKKHQQCEPNLSKLLPLRLCSWESWLQHLELLLD